MMTAKAMAALLAVGVALPAMAQEQDWFRVGEQIFIELPEGAVLMNAAPEDIYFTENYAIEVDGAGTVLTALRFFTAREGTVMSTASLLEAADTMRTWLTVGCPAMELDDRSLAPVAGRPAMQMALRCPESSTSSQAGEAILLTVISGEERLHAVMLVSGPDTSPTLFEAHAARMAAAEFCTIAESGGPCLTP